MEDMKSKFLYACLGISICMNIFLGGYTLMNPPVCEYTHIDVIDRTKDYYKKDEAVRLAAASFGLEEDWETQENPVYDVEVVENTETYEWVVIFTPKNPEEGVETRIGVRRDIGIITYY